MYIEQFIGFPFVVVIRNYNSYRRHRLVSELITLRLYLIVFASCLSVNLDKMYRTHKSCRRWEEHTGCHSVCDTVGNHVTIRFELGTCVL